MGPGATAYGWRAQAATERATALGHLANASGTRSTAVGEAASASGETSVAIGNLASASGTNSVAIGNGATAANDGQVVIASLDASTASQTGPISVVTADSNGTIGLSTTPGLTGLASFNDVQMNSAAISANSSAIGMNSMAITNLQGQTAELYDLADENRRDIRKANEGVAMALAMDSPVIMPGQSYGVSGGFGYYGERTAGTAAFAARVGSAASVSAGVGVGFDSGEVGARAGFQFGW